MKKLILAISIPTLLLVLMMFAAFNSPDTRDQARVNKRNGLYIFIESKPTAAYDVLGTVEKHGVTWSNKAEEMINIIIRRCNKQYSNADGLIFDNIELKEATAIRFR